MRFFQPSGSHLLFTTYLYTYKKNILLYIYLSKMAHKTNIFLIYLDKCDAEHCPITDSGTTFNGFISTVES